VAELTACRAVSNLLSPVQLTHGGLRFGQEQSPYLGERHCRPLATVQQTSAKHLLKLLYLQADGGLRHVQPVSGAREAELFGDGYEIAKLASVKHVPIQSVSLIKTQRFDVGAQIHLDVIEV
jgi:hypothetical protein